jgi:hypothetical protein
VPSTLQSRVAEAWPAPNTAKTLAMATIAIPSRLANAISCSSDSFDPRSGVI